MDVFTRFILALLVILIICSIFFSASETAFTACNKIKLKNLLSSGKKRAKLVLALLENYDRLLSTILIGNNIANVTASALATLIFVRLLGQNAGVGIATLVTTVVIVFAGEITPKTLAREAPESCAMFCAPLLKCFMFLFHPLSLLAIRWKATLMKLLHIDIDRSITEEELLTFVEEARQEGGINEREEVMIKRTIDFDDKTAEDMCTRRVDIVAVSSTDSAEAIDRKFRQTRFSRLPVFENSIDNITGVILLKDFQYEIAGTDRPPVSIMKQAVYIPHSVKAARVLRILQEKKSHLAVIIDEFGGTLGIITIEDVVEELVGEIWDEHDEVIENITKLDEEEALVLGRATLRELLTHFAIEYADEDRVLPPNAGDAITVAALFLEKLGGDLAVGAVYEWAGLTLTITKLRLNSVAEVSARRLSCLT